MTTSSKTGTSSNTIGIVPLVQTGTSACMMRDKLLLARSEGKIKLTEITNRMAKIELPMWLQSEIVQMCDYRKYDRITCPVEQAMFAAVNIHIIKELDVVMKEMGLD